MTSTIKGMNENSVKVDMLSTTSEFVPEDALVIVDKQRDETVYHRQYVPFIEEVRGASPEREKTQEGMTSSATRTDDDENRDD